jgi:hypothetical protein
MNRFDWSEIISWGYLTIAVIILYLMFAYLPSKMPPIDVSDYYEPVPDEVGRSIFP